jgi:CheY-like chemotaxis protein
MSLLENIRILVVDDEPILRDMLSDLFSAEGAKVSVASNGEAALATLLQQDFDILFSDVRMPNGGGPDLVRSMPTDKKNNLQIYFFSGYNDLSSEDLLDLGVTSLFVKPFDLETIPVQLASGMKKLSTNAQ